MSENDDFRGRRKKVVTTSADAEAFIRAQRESRKEFEANEGKPLYEHDQEMDRLHGEHAQIGAREAATQSEFSEKRREEDINREMEEQQQDAEQQSEQQEQARSM